VGQLIGGKYAIDGLIARGGMGLVYAARHSSTGRSVAIKILRPELATRADLVRRVSAEARLAVEASHPNVVEVLDAGADDDGIPFVVLERLHGSAFDAFLAAPIALLPAMQALVPIANALVSLHEAGIVHRDIKPSNIFLSRQRDGRITPKLLDFGIAKALEATGMTLSGAALGTPAYMAPEQALGLGDAGPATDIWSLAVVFVRALTGQLPFEGPPQRRMGSLRAGLEPAVLAGVPEALGRTLLRALRFEPGERFSTMTEFRAALLGAAHEVDPNLRWPHAETVAYAAEESALSLWLGTTAFEEPAAPDDASSNRRPPDVDTKTLHALNSAVSSSLAEKSPRLSRNIWLSLLALSALGALGLARLAARNPPASSQSTQPSMTSVEPAGPSSASTPQTDVLSMQPEVAPTTRESSPTAAPLDGAAASKLPARRSPSSAPPTPPRAPSKAPGSPAADRQNPEHAGQKSAFGANRAPIIE